MCKAIFVFTTGKSSIKWQIPLKFWYKPNNASICFKFLTSVKCFAWLFVLHHPFHQLGLSDEQIEDNLKFLITDVCTHKPLSAGRWNQRVGFIYLSVYCRTVKSRWVTKPLLLQWICSISESIILKPNWWHSYLFTM